MSDGHTKKTTDFWGNEKEEHFDSSGNKVGETRFTTNLWGTSKQEHFDTSGRKTGETRRESGLFGDKAVHYDSSGRTIGHSNDTTNLWNQPIQEHYDSSGTKVGTSRRGTDFFGRRRKEHEGTYFKAGTQSTGAATAGPSGGWGGTLPTNQAARRATDPSGTASGRSTSGVSGSVVFWVLVIAVALIWSGASAWEKSESARTGSPTATARASTFSGTRRPIAATATPTSANTDQQAASYSRYVANTGGIGVRIRATCADAAGIAGVGIPEGAEITVVREGVNQCEGWAYAQSRSTGTWIRERYLSATRPVTVAATPLTAPASTATARFANPTAVPAQATVVPRTRVAAANLQRDLARQSRTIDITDIEEYGEDVWAVGEIGGGEGDNFGVIFHSPDEGASWNLQYYDYGNIFWEGRPIPFHVEFVSAKVGWVIADTIIYRTADGGETWERVWKIPTPFTSVASFVIVDALRAEVETTSGLAYSTSDGAETWECSDAPCMLDLLPVRPRS